MATNTTIGQKQHHREPPDGAIHSDRRHLANIVIGYSNQVEEITANLEKKEEELQQRPSESALQDLSFNCLLDEYSVHEKYMTELSEYCHTIMRSKEEGQELRDNESLSNEDRDEVDLQMDAMLVFYDRLKILATDRLQILQKIIDERQRSKIERLEKYLGIMESRLSNYNNIGPDFDAIHRQLDDARELRQELEQKQEFLNFISRVIIFDDVDSGSFQLRSRSSGTLDSQLENMNLRWTNICKCVDERYEKLRKAESIWKLLSVEGPQLYAWLDRIKINLNGLLEVVQNATTLENEEDFLRKLMVRSEQIDQKIKCKQSFYTGLENRVRIEIDKFDDPCSMFVIELEKKLEDMQDNWNSMMRQKRMIDFSLNALCNPDLANQSNLSPLKPIEINQCSNPGQPSNHIIENCTPSAINDEINGKNQSIFLYDEHLTASSSTGHDDEGSSFRLNGSLSDPSKGFDTSYSSQDTRFMSASNNMRPKNNHNNSRDEISTDTNLTSNQLTTNHTEMIYSDQEDSSHICGPSAGVDSFELELDGLDLQPPDIRTNPHAQHNCRVEEWRQSLESFSSWLRQVEYSLEIGFNPIASSCNEPERYASNHRSTWSHMSLIDQLTLLRDIDKRIKTTCQDEFDCLLLQGQQIIEDLLPEIGEKNYEAKLEVLLADLKLRYGSVKKSLEDRKQELADKDRWSKLSRKMRDSCNFIIERMSEVIPENEIGVDLITLAQQQDSLMRLKDESENNNVIQSSIREAKSFVHICESLQHQYGQQNFHQQELDDFVHIWKSFKEFKEDIEDQLDRLKLHHSELSQLIEDRLSRLDAIHKEMHALQHSIQDLATRLQMAEILRSDWIPLDNLSIEQLSVQLEDLKLYRERLSEVEASHRVMNSILDWMEQFNSPLSQSNLKRIAELNGIWDTIQVLVDQRQKDIEQAFDEQSGSEQKFLTVTVSDVPGKWERRVATSKVPYFIDHVSSKTVWDHPKFTHMLNDLNDCKQYIYSVYRTAIKLRIIQKKLGIEKLMLEHLKDMFASLDLQLEQQQQAVASVEATSGDMDKIQPKNHDTQINVEQIIFILKAIYTKIQSEETPDLDVPVAIDLTLNWLLNLYDSTRTGQISALSLKVGLSLMCCATREEKYVYMFELISDRSSGTVDARRLGILFELCRRPPIYLGEEESFGGTDLIEISIRNCFAMSKFNPQHPNCIDINDYLNWLKTEPQFIIWLPVLHRILISENTVHAVKCRLCKQSPIVGLRYRCLKCFKFNICQNCFLKGRNIHEHLDPYEHQMQEYCHKTGTGEKVRDLAKILRNKINPRSHRA